MMVIVVNNHQFIFKVYLEDDNKRFIHMHPFIFLQRCFQVLVMVWI